MTKIHRLKTVSWSYDSVKEGLKLFEIRLNDRGFQKGDIVELVRLREESGIIDSTAPILRKEITFVTHFQQKEGWCVFGISYEDK